MLVDEQDRPLGDATRETCHTLPGHMHRAFAILLFTPAGELLLCQRSAAKALWPLVGDGSVASHPRLGESYDEACRRALGAELGLEVSLSRVGHIVYRAPYGERGVEHEYCALFRGTVEAPVVPNPAEVAAWRTLDLAALRRAIAAEPASYSPWLALALQHPAFR